MAFSSLLSRTAPSPREQADQLKQLVSFRIGDEEFGVDILMVQEIIRLPAITPVPNAPPFIVGMINLRGMILPVIDLRQRLTIRGSDNRLDNRKARVLVVEVFHHITGFIVDAVSEVLKVPMSAIEPTPHLVASNIDAEYILGVIKQEERLIVLLDFERILKPRERQQLEQIDLEISEGASGEEEPELEFSFSMPS